MTHTVPYTFAFPGGVARQSYIERSSPYVLDGLRHRVGYRLVDDCLLGPFERFLEPELADLIDVCTAMALSDRQAPRDPGNLNIPDRKRRLEITVPLRKPEVWMRDEVLDCFLELVESLTGDECTIRFERRCRDPRRAELQIPLPLGPNIGDAIVILHSGGLDSLLGMAQELIRNEHSVLVPVSIISNSKAGPVIAGITQSLRRSFPNATIQSSRLWVSRSGSSDRIYDRASDYRTRILPCLAAGVCVAAVVGSGQLRLTENGPGAINLPTSTEQRDVWLTRSTHPATLIAFAKVASLVLDRDIQIHNSGLLLTKGQLALQLRDCRLWEAAQRTLSCERFPYANWNCPCGTCMSCLFRQMALHRAGMAHIDADRHSNIGRAHQPESGRGLDVEMAALGLFAARLEILLSSPAPYHALDVEYRRIDEVRAVAAQLGMTDLGIRTALIALYQEFLNEMCGFLDASGRIIALPTAHAIAS